MKEEGRGERGSGWGEGKERSKSTNKDESLRQVSAVQRDRMNTEQDNVFGKT